MPYVRARVFVLDIRPDLNHDLSTEGLPMAIFDLAVVHFFWIVVPPVAAIAGFVVLAARSHASEKRILTAAIIVLASLESVAAVGGFLLFGGTRVSHLDVVNATSREISISSGTRAASRVQPGATRGISAVGRICSVVITTDIPAVEVVIRPSKCGFGNRSITATSTDPAAR